MRQEKIDGIILQSKNMFEHDKLVEVLSPTHGRLRVLVKYANSRRSQLKGKCEPTHVVSMVVSQGKSFMWSSQVDVKDTFMGIRQSFNRISLACYMMNVARHITVENQPNLKLYTLLHDHFNDLNQGESLERIQQRFQWGILQIEGLMNHQEEVPFTRFKQHVEEYCGKAIEQPIYI